MAEKKESYSEEELNEMIVWFNNHADEVLTQKSSGYL